MSAMIDLLARADEFTEIPGRVVHATPLVRDLAAALRGMIRQRDDWLRNAITHDGHMYEAGTIHAIQGFIRPECTCGPPEDDTTEYVRSPLCPVHPSARQAAALRAVVDYVKDTDNWDDWNGLWVGRLSLERILAEHGVNVDA